MTLTWPDAREIPRLNQIIFETGIDPFGVAAYNRNEPVTDFVGRREELQVFKSQIQLVQEHKVSRAVRLSGPAGVGKSTLFNYLKESIEKERENPDKFTEYVARDTDIFSTYFQVPDRIIEFSDIWKPMLDGLRANFEPETGMDISLPEYIVFRLVFLLLHEDPEGMVPVIWGPEKKETNIHGIKLKEIIDQLMDRGTSAVQDLQKYYSTHRRPIRTLLRTQLGQNTYEITRSDNQFILDLFRVIDEDDPEDFLEEISSGSATLFHSTDELIEYFNNLLRLYACITKKKPLMLIGIDEIAKADPGAIETYFQNLGNLFVRLRNSLNYILFVFISTTEDWAQYDQVIDSHTDLKNQIAEFIYTMELKQLPVNELIQVFKYRMDRFWKQYAAHRSAQCPYYPFTEIMFEYTYRLKHRDMRKSIHYLRRLWQDFRYTRKIPRMERYFDCMQVVREFDDTPFFPTHLSKFEWNIIRREFEKSGRFKTNGTRSSAVEVGLERAWTCIMQERASAITRVQNNPVITTSGGKRRRPDVYVEIHGNLGAEYRRVVEFQVKVYAPNSEVHLKDIESSLELFNENYTDFIYFIITGKGLHPEAEATVLALENTFKTRIRRPPLNERQINVLYLLSLYKEITGHDLGDLEGDIHIAKDLVAILLGQTVEEFLQEVRALSYRAPQGGTGPSPDTTEPVSLGPGMIPGQPAQRVLDFPSHSSAPAKVVGQTENLPRAGSPPPSEKSVPGITSEPLKHPKEGSRFPPEPSWLEAYPDFVKFKYELVALCQYLKDRESGRYAFKFTTNTVERNVIEKDAGLDKDHFRKLVKILTNQGFLQKVKSSYALTKTGKELYENIKKAKYSC